MSSSSTATAATATATLPRAPAHPAAQDAPAVRVQGLRKTFGKHEALAGVSLEVGRGELLALLGPNGSGKSTLLRILATLLLPDGGEAWLDGQDLLRNAAAARHRLGVVFQSPSLDAQLTVAENLRFQGWLYGLAGRALKARVALALERAGLADRAGTKAGVLSGGLKRRVELAKALLHEPRVLLLDEPSTGLDPAARNAFWEQVLHLQEADGLTVIAATHLLDEAERCGRVALLNAGTLAALDTPAALKQGLGRATLFVEVAHGAGVQADVLQRLGRFAGLRARPTRGGVLLEGEPLPDAQAVLEAGGEAVQAVRLGRPTLEDVYLHLTGKRIAEDSAGHGDTADANGTGSDPEPAAPPTSGTGGRPA